jgi:hypothetical protein
MIIFTIIMFSFVFYVFYYSIHNPQDRYKLGYIDGYKYHNSSHYYNLKSQNNEYSSGYILGYELYENDTAHVRQISK